MTDASGKFRVDYTIQQTGTKIVVRTQQDRLLPTDDPDRRAERQYCKVFEVSPSDQGGRGRGA